MARTDVGLYGSSSSEAAYLSSSSRRLLRPYAKALLARSTCIHPQLRSLLVCPNVPGEVFGHNYHALVSYTMPGRKGVFGLASPGRRDHLQSLNFIPNVIVRGCGLIGAGGHNAELAIRSSDTTQKWCIQTHVGSSINNSVHISPSPFSPLSTPRIYCSNNDSCIYWHDLHFPKRSGSMEDQRMFADEEENYYGYDADERHAALGDASHSGRNVAGTAEDPLGRGEWARQGQEDGVSDSMEDPEDKPELEYIGKVRLPTPVNHTSLSPDGRTMIAVGDTNELFIFNIGSNGTHTLVDTIEVTSESGDSSFSTSWSRTGETFAVASQSGFVTIYDRRSLPSSSLSHTTPLKVFTTYQRSSSSTAGAARVVKYSQGPNELLAFSEQKGYIHVVDARTFEFEERIWLPGVQLEDGISTPMQSSYEAPAVRGWSTPASAAAPASPAQTHHGQQQQRRFVRPPYTSMSTNPWDTMPSDLFTWQDCPPGTTSDASVIAIEAEARRLSSPSSPSAPIPQHLFTTHQPIPRGDSHAHAPARSGHALPRPSSEGHETVASLLRTLGSTATVSSAAYDQLRSEVDSMNERAPTSIHYARPDDANPNNSTAITGLDWDPSGRFLYASMERVIIEWSVDEGSRRCHPSASLL